jgi:ribonuclease VapC
VTILDASAVLGLLQGEPRASVVVSHLDEAAMSAVNHAEVVGKLVVAGMSAAMADGVVRLLHIDVVPFNEHHAILAGELRSSTSHLGLSLGDRACLATALVDGSAVVTLDRRWDALDLGIAMVVCD